MVVERVLVTARAVKNDKPAQETWFGGMLYICMLCMHMLRHETLVVLS